MSVYVKNDTVVVKDSSVATSNDCCCVAGACCIDGECSIITEMACTEAGGTYQGDDTTCDPNPCATGACCVGTDCSITTESDCTGMGGTYQGDDTTCDPNPCETIVTPCCADAFHGYIDDSTRFLTHTKHFTYSDSSPAGLCSSNWDYTSIYTIDPITCIVTVECSGSGSFDGPGGSFTWTWELNSFTHDCACSTTSPPIGVCTPCGSNVCSAGTSGPPISNTELLATCHHEEPPTDFVSDSTVTDILSNPCVSP